MLKTTAPSLLSASGMVAILLLISRTGLLQKLSLWPALICQVLVGALVASLILLWADKDLLKMVHNVAARLDPRAGTRELAFLSLVPKVGTLEKGQGPEN